MTMNCDDAFEKLYQFLDKDLGDAPMDDLEKHLKVCRHCWDYFEFERKLKERCKTSCQNEPLPESLRRRIQTLLQKY